MEDNREYALANTTTRTVGQRGDDTTCRYLPEVVYTYFDDDDEELEFDPPRQDDSNGESYECEACGYVMLSDWFEEYEAEDGHGYKYHPNFNYCPDCGRRVLPCFGREGAM